jgi:hypothetical protein
MSYDERPPPLPPMMTAQEHEADVQPQLSKGTPNRKGNGADHSEDAELERLAKLSVISYERERAEAAKRLGMRTGMLDRLITLKRGKAGDDGKQGHAIEFPSPEPWPTAVAGAKLLDDIASAIGRHVIMSDHPGAHYCAYGDREVWLHGECERLFALRMGDQKGKYANDLHE